MLRKLMKRLGYVKVPEVRSFKAAHSSRLRSQWGTTISSINSDIKAGIGPVRARAREAVQNNDYAKGYLLKNRANILGPGGIRLQSTILKKGFDVYSEPGAEDYDERAIRLIETKFKEWSRAEYCTMQGIMTFKQVQDLMVMYLRRDGEFLAREIKGTRVNKFGYSLQLLDPEDLDDQLSTELENGNTIINGVEVNDWRKPVAFHFFKKKVISDINAHVSRQEHWRIPASEIIHVFDREYIKQTRQVSPMVQSLIALKMLDEWEDKSLVNATLSAAHMGFFTKARLENEQFKGDNQEGDNEYEQILNYEEGTFRELPYGIDVKTLDPQFPHEQHLPFVKGILRRIGSGLGISYNSLSNDLEGVNYSSLKSGRLDERDIWRTFQNLLVDSVLTRLFENWLKMSLMTGEIAFGYAEYERLKAHSWLRRGWREVEPLKQAAADKAKLEMRTESISNIIAEEGRDPIELLHEIARDKMNIKKILGEEMYGYSGNGKAGADSGDTAEAGDNGDSSGDDGTGAATGRGKENSNLELLFRI